MSRSGSAAAVFLLLLVVSCEDPVEPPRVHHTSCDDAPGLTHAGSIGNAVWRAADGPHRFRGTVTFSTLEVEAGTLVCGEPGAVLRGDSLTAIGTGDAPIVFAAYDPAEPWGGLELWSGVDWRSNALHHVVIRDLARGVVGSRLELVNTRVERACRQGYPCAAVEAERLRLQDVIIDSSGDVGVDSGRHGALILTRVRIQNSAGVGLDVSGGDGGAYRVGVTAEGLRIVGGASYPARIGAWHLEQLAGSREAVDSLTGNASDTLLIAVVHDSVGPMTVYGDLAWRLVLTAYQGNPSRLITPELTLEAGASISFEHHELILRARRLNALGTAAEPVVLEGGELSLGAADSDPATDTARLTNTRLVRMYVRPFWGGGPVTLDVDGLEASRTAVHLDGAGTFRNASFDSSLVMTAGEAVFEDVDFVRAGFHFYPSEFVGGPAPAIQVDSGAVTISGCEIRDGLSDALRVGEAAAAGTSITDCNLVGNAGFGVNNLSVFTVDAAGNWWGDPAGPDGPDGDDVSGDVVVEPVLAGPVSR